MTGVVPRRRPPAQGPGADAGRLVEALDLSFARRAGGPLPGEHRAPGVGAGTELAALRAYQPGDDVRRLDAAATARTGEPHVRLDVPERLLTTWVVLDVSPSMAFGTAERLKSDVAEGAVRVLAARGHPPRRARGADGLRRREPSSCCRPAAGAGRRGVERAARRGRRPGRARRRGRARARAAPARRDWPAARPGRRRVRLPRPARGWAARSRARCPPLGPRRRGARPPRARAAGGRPAALVDPETGAQRRGRRDGASASASRAASAREREAVRR